MIYLPLNLLEPGMVLAREVPSANRVLPLMSAGQALTRASIFQIQARRIQGLYVEFQPADDLECPELIPPEQKNAMLSHIQREFQKTEKTGVLPSYQAISHMAESLVLNILSSDRLLSNVLEIRDHDNYTYSHSLYVGLAATVLGSNLDMPPKKLTELATAGILHDLGKLDIPKEIINKPAPLTDEEFTLMKEHPRLAIDRLRKLPGCKEIVVQGVITHHECYDGSGYPCGLAGSHIPLFGRILALADVYDALSASRSYRSAWSPSQIIDYIGSRAGSQFDPLLVKAFLHSVTAYPVGTPIELSDGSVGLVIRNHRDLPLRPVVRLLSPPALKGREVDLSIQSLHVVVVGVVSDTRALTQS